MNRIVRKIPLPTMHFPSRKIYMKTLLNGRFLMVSLVLKRHFTLDYRSPAPSASHPSHSIDPIKDAFKAICDIVVHGTTCDLRNLLEKEGIDPNILNDEMKTPLMIAAENNLLDMMKTLLDLGAQLNLQDIFGIPTIILI
jgi:ankyrin repeat protein